MNDSTERAWWVFRLPSGAEAYVPGRDFADARTSLRATAYPGAPAHEWPLVRTLWTSRSRLVASLLAAALVVLACGPAVHPPVGPGTPYPCGLHGRSCGDHMCCAESETCGGPDPAGFVRCPAGYCCDDREDDWPNVGARPQWRELTACDDGGVCETRRAP